MKKNNNKGFTLAELLIVVAIIAVLTAIAIPVFTAQLEKSREATDLSNIRAAYAEVTAEGLLNDKATNIERKFKLKQTQDNWQSAEHTCAGTTLGDDIAKKEGDITVKWVPATADKEGHVTVNGTAIANTTGSGT